MKLVFLDMDGVLNRYGPLDPDDVQVFGPSTTVHPELVALFNGLVEATGAKIVVSSTWRKLVYGSGVAPMSFDEFTQGLASCGIKGTIIGITPVLMPERRRLSDYSTSMPRRDEIKAYLASVCCPLEYVILDDDADARIPGHTVLTDPRIGLTSKNVADAIRILKC